MGFIRGSTHLIYYLPYVAYTKILTLKLKYSAIRLEVFCIKTESHDGVTSCLENTPNSSSIIIIKNSPILLRNSTSRRL